MSSHVTLLLDLLHNAIHNPALLVALNIVTCEERDKGITMRMPKDIALFDELWAAIQDAVKAHNESSPRKLSVSRAGSWPTVAELALVLGSVKWLWKKWIPSGFLTLLVGEPGSGKSYIALDWIRRVIEPAAWPTGEINTSKKFAIWIETESSQQLLTARSTALKLDMNRIIVPGFGNDLLGQPDLMSENDRRRVINAIDQIKPGIVVLDSLGGAHTRGENRIEEVRPMLDFLARLARDTVTPIVAVHHLRKRSAGESIEISLDRVRGSSAFSAFARAIVAVDGSANRQLSVIKSNLSERPEPLTVNFLRDTKRDDEVCGISYETWKAAPHKRNRKELCMDWVRQRLLVEPDEPTALMQLCSEAEAQGYTRNLIYATRELFGDELVITGNGRSASWQLSNGAMGELNGLISDSIGR